MRAQLARMADQMGFARWLVGRFDRIEKRLERNLRVDDHISSTCEPDNDVGPEPPVVGLQRDLLVEIAVLEHSGHLHDAPQLELTPAPAGRRSTQRGNEIPGLRLQFVLGFVELLDLLDESGIGVLTVRFEVAQTLLVAVELIAKWSEKLLDRLGASIHVPFCGLLNQLESSFCKLEELLAVLA